MEMAWNFLAAFVSVRILPIAETVGDAHCVATSLYQPMRDNRKCLSVTVDWWTHSALAQCDVKVYFDGYSIPIMRQIW